VIPCRNAIPVNAGLGQCSSTFLSPGLRFAPPWAVWLLPPHKGACFTANLRFMLDIEIYINILLKYFMGYL
ncbi:MAG: hypothetical protein IKB16_05665, partial [Lentisphaeria bacterium]|nr:hypothetical protein [Lentisphaeria bacterium]